MYPPHYLRPGGRICQILNAEQPDLIEVCDKYTLPYMTGLLRIGRLKGVDLRVPVLGLSCERMDENMLAYFSHSAVGRRFCRWYMKNIYFPQFDHHIANSEHTAGELREAARGHKVRRGVWVCPMGVDCSRFSPSMRSPELRRSLLKRAGAPESSTLLLYAGRLDPEKNLNLLIDALQMLAKRNAADYRLLIAGQGMSRAMFERSCRERIPGMALFLGHVADKEELARIYASCDTFVHPNPREPFGIAPLEAMASGLPLVAPDTGGITSYANASNAWLAPAEAAAFACAIDRVRTASGDRDRKVGNALKTAAAFDWPVIAREFLQLYREMARSFHEGREPVRAPYFYSTQGDYWGRETNIR
jgi:glycosyltransferase involved in cell wall biosynthesis